MNLVTPTGSNIATAVQSRISPRVALPSAVLQRPGAVDRVQGFLPASLSSINYHTSVAHITQPQEFRRSTISTTAASPPNSLEHVLPQTAGCYPAGLGYTPLASKAAAAPVVWSSCPNMVLQQQPTPSAAATSACHLVRTTSQTVASVSPTSRAYPPGLGWTPVYSTSNYINFNLSNPSVGPVQGITALAKMNAEERHADQDEVAREDEGAGGVQDVAALPRDLLLFFRGGPCEPADTAQEVGFVLPQPGFLRTAPVEGAPLSNGAEIQKASRAGQQKQQQQQQQLQQPLQPQKQSQAFQKQTQAQRAPHQPKVAHHAPSGLQKVNSGVRVGKGVGKSRGAAKFPQKQ